MAIFLPNTLKAKLQMMSIVSTGVALIAACGALALYDYRTYLAAFISDMETYASIVAQNSTAAVSFHDEKDATQTLASLEAEPHAVAACVYDGKGKRLATYFRDAKIALPDLGNSNPESYNFGPDRLEVLVAGSIERRGDRGEVYVQLDLEARCGRARTSTLGGFRGGGAGGDGHRVDSGGPV